MSFRIGRCQPEVTSGVGDCSPDEVVEENARTMLAVEARIVEIQIIVPKRQAQFAVNESKEGETVLGITSGDGAIVARAGT